jgi:hypothetical protein
MAINQSMVSVAHSQVIVNRLSRIESWFDGHCCKRNRACTLQENDETLQEVVQLRIPRVSPRSKCEIRRERHFLIISTENLGMPMCLVTILLLRVRPPFNIAFKIRYDHHTAVRTGINAEDS